jgi:uncharacterized protein (TIGR02444 family)
MENPLWAYSLAHYRRNGVEKLCLQLQDEFGLDVNLLLYAAWLASQRQTLTAEHLEAIAAATGDWRREVVQPLRELRRGFKSISGTDKLRGRLAELELAAEQQQQALIYAWHQSAACHHSAALQPDSGSSLTANLHRVASAQTCSTQRPWQPVIAQLEAALLP